MLDLPDSDLLLLELDPEDPLLRFDELSELELDPEDLLSFEADTDLEESLFEILEDPLFETMASLSSSAGEEMEEPLFEVLEETIFEPDPDLEEEEPLSESELGTTASFFSSAEGGFTADLYCLVRTSALPVDEDAFEVFGLGARVFGNALCADAEGNLSN